MNNPLFVSTVLFAFLCFVFLVATVVVCKKKKIFATASNFLIALLMLSLTALFGTISLAIQGYRALTREDLAATVKVEPVGPQQFRASIALPDGERKTFSLSGDEVYVDAHILKWKPWANIFGLHTSYELDRVSGRYSALTDEKTKPHTVFSLSVDKPVDMFELRRKFAMLDPLLDAEYGSATFINTSAAEEFHVMVSTTGLLIRKVETGQGK
ncbi:MAG TPA: hypothetical protein VF903_09935 [Nitrospirota bacterium]